LSYLPGVAGAILEAEHTKEPAMNRRMVVCPSCELRFLSGRQRTYCPGCHLLIEPETVS
jgi:hypothetical protein